MKHHTLFAAGSMLVLVCCFSCTKRNQKADFDAVVQELDQRRIVLPNGWGLSPAGKDLPLGDFPLNLILSSSGKFMAVTNNGQGRQTITLIDPSKEAILDEVAISKSWYGLAFNNAESRLYASGGNDNMIVVYDLSNSRLEKMDSIVLGKPWPVKISPTGIALDDTSGKLFIATKEDSSLYVADIRTKDFRKLKLGYEGYACLLSPDRKTLYVSLWGGHKVALVDVGELKIKSTIDVGSNPNEMVLTRDGKYLFVAQANDNAVSVIQTDNRKVIEVLSSAVVPGSLAGSTPNALTLSEDETKLYVANADNNCLAVFDVHDPGKGTGLGFLPTGWYPTSVKVWNKKIWVTNGKGFQSMANPRGPNPYKPRTDSTQYIASLFKGSLSIIDQPDEEILNAYSQAVFTNTPYSKAIEKTSSGQEGNPIPTQAGKASPIKYVFYVIKENRTYDQVFGDIETGNGDSSLCLFSESVTPNHHALAKEFVLLDNFYVNAEVSADGHNWSTAAYANDYIEKTWPTNYSSRGGTYDYEGTRAIAFPKAGFIWDYCARLGVSYRNYGEFTGHGKANVISLNGHFDPDFPTFDLTVPDRVRFQIWKQDFDSLVEVGAVPQLSIIRLPNDHTAGAKSGMPTPRAMVAENDLALGALVSYISKSPIWKEAAIFVLEDDAQNGPDHVDAHRSIALVISPYARRKETISQMYSTTSMLRTMELILGLPPMSQYDAAATPMWECFKPEPELQSFEALPASYDIHELNKKGTVIADQSAHFNFEVMDAVPDLELSEVIWKAVKGMDSEMPAPVRSAFVSPHDTGEDAFE
jgi:DNA-binding beta-propeller fold protein YncE